MQSTHPGRSILVIVPALFVATFAGSAGAEGESVNGFPNWAERVLHEWTNRARVDPHLEMVACGSDCGEGSCYTAQPPVAYMLALNHAARFHADEMVHQNYFAHNSQCTLVSNLDSLYPGSCDGSASCACVGGTKACNPTCTQWNARVKLFGPTASYEIIASPSDPDYAFYLWLYEPSSSPNCGFSSSNGHRWAILSAPGSVGFGSSGLSVGDFSNTANPTKIPSGSHYPRQGSSVALWANWYDTAAPLSAAVNVDGTCTNLSLARGTATNGAWTTSSSAVSSGCHRYYFIFIDSGNNMVTFPSTGSLGIGPEGTCADWDTSRPVAGTGCTCLPQCVNKACGDDACGGSCGSCNAGYACQGNQCVCVPNCAGKACGDDSCGGSCGGCNAGYACQGNQCVCVPNCAGKACGDDSCGGSCGTCNPGFACQADQCVCVPNCAGKACGDDGCGGSCGACNPGYACQADQCVCVPDCTGKVCGDDTCGGSCGGCPTGQSCQGGVCQACTANCVGKVCGDDGCQGICGNCGANQVCELGACVAADAATQDVTPPKDSSIADTSKDGPKSDAKTSDATINDAKANDAKDAKVVDAKVVDGARSDAEAGAGLQAEPGDLFGGGCACSSVGQQRSASELGLAALLFGVVLGRRRRLGSKEEEGEKGCAIGESDLGTRRRFGSP